MRVPCIYHCTSEPYRFFGRAAELERLGFEIEPFGGATIRVAAVPALLRTEDSSKALLALAEDLEGLDRGAHVRDALQRIAATTAPGNRGSIRVLENTSTRILVCARERGLFRADVSRCLNCKKYNLGRENHTKLGY